MKNILIVIALACMGGLTITSLNGYFREKFTAAKTALKSGYEATKQTVKSGYETTQAALNAAASWTAQQLDSAKQSVTNTYKKALDAISSGITTHAHAKNVAHVRTEDNLCQQEKQFLQVRGQKTKNAIRALFPDLELADDEIPTIAFVDSGGGCRAMIETAGSLAAAQDTGLLDTFSYMGGLSGSTWYINPLVASGLQPKEYLELLIENFQKSPFGRSIPLGIRLPSPRELTHLAQDLVIKKAYGQSLNILNLYGFLLANEFLSGMPSVKERGGGRKHWYTMSHLQDNLREGQYPLPVSTALETSQAPAITKWFEFTPFEAGTYHTGVRAYVPIWALGRNFNDGSSTNASPELTLGYLMAICGSAFALDSWGLLHETIKRLLPLLPTSVATELETSFHGLSKEILDPELRTEEEGVINNVVNTYYLGERTHRQIIRKVTAGKVDNYTYGMPNQLMTRLSKLVLVDGGHEIMQLPYDKQAWGRLNLGIMPLLQPARKVDLFVICDASDNLTTEGAKALGAAETRAKLDGLAFPTISPEAYAQAHKQTVSVFGAQENNVPTIVYIPGLLDDKAAAFAKTLNFKYSPEQIRHLSSITHQRFIESVPAMQQAIYDTIMKKRALRQGH